MPTYEYRCRQCHESFSVRGKIAEYDTANAPICPRCQSREVERVLSGFYAKTVRKS